MVHSCLIIKFYFGYKITLEFCSKFVIGDSKRMERGVWIGNAKHGFDIESELSKWTVEVWRAMQGVSDRPQPWRNSAGSAGHSQAHGSRRLGRFPICQRIGRLGRWSFWWPRSFGLVSEWLCPDWEM